MPKDDKTELFYWVDENDIELGSISRAEAHGGGRKIHRSIYVLLFDQKDQVLLQRRSEEKDIHPGSWTVSTSGHVTYGQSYQEAAKRELEEEIGIRSGDLKEVGSMQHKSNQEREMGKIYTCMYDDQEILPDEDEISEVRWVEKSKLREFSRQNIITPAARKVFEIMGLM